MTQCPEIRSFNEVRGNKRRQTLYSKDIFLDWNTPAEMSLPIKARCILFVKQASEVTILKETRNNLIIKSQI